MKDVVLKILADREALIFTTVLTIIGLNILLTGLGRALSWVKDKTESKLDDEAYAVVVKLLHACEAVLSYASANSALFPSRVKAELDKREWDAQAKSKPNPSVPEAK